MKRIIFIFTFLSLIWSVYSIEEILIDFNDIRDTTIDFSKFTVADWPPEQLKYMNVDLHPSKWVVFVNSSSFNVESRNRTYPFLAKVKIMSPIESEVLAVRAFLPQKYANSNITIKTPFEIPSFYMSPHKEDDYMGTMFLNKGVVRNVGIMRKLSVFMCGNNFNYTLYVRIKDQRGVERDIYIGYINFTGWQTRAWTNPDYDNQLILKDMYKKTRPYYPDEYPYIKLVGFIINRIDTEVTGNFVTMIKEVTVEFDEEFVDIRSSSGEDLIPSVMTEEKIFGIYQEELMKRATAEMENVNVFLYHQWENKMKMDVPYR
ncbi:MAG TPA: flagellar filament outer layer protein FlaA [Spirochaetota bacterium]|jgi:hypothetical protein|nr:MAG: Flagellar filament outer layer protein precursor [Spirochaetes bacterium ADurb.Bin133]HNZ26965.1 flagellar filament outer layer protein FlaA [Spirochaetota bacterium]HOF00383.1 flagellar filament outer layer protein FlaA [Spirochaetota bacterium]HOS33247.1 flagellar filament outer layer protein FlaA [Spirochaetota bacterium]HOS54830.1 flagellar filament outer layer protein FlaA [Spirochaetota bacterium]